MKHGILFTETTVDQWYVTGKGVSQNKNLNWNFFKENNLICKASLV